MQRLKSFPRTAFAMWQFSIGLYCIFTQFFKLNIKFKAKHDIKHDKNSIFFLHQALNYNKIYNFTLDY